MQTSRVCAGQGFSRADKVLVVFTLIIGVATLLPASAAAAAAVFMPNHDGLT